MAVISPPAYLQSGSHSAKGDRQVASALAGHTIGTFTNSVGAVDVGHGLVRPGHLAVAQKSGTPNMSVDVAAGIALVTGSSLLAQGVYVFANDAVVNLAIATANATNPRRDLVIAQVRDNTSDGGGSNDARLAVVTGTPAASPVDPAIPAGCLVVARVAVAAAATSIVNANITALAGLARGSAWNQSWGVIAYAEKTTNQSTITSAIDITGLSVTWTAIPSRRYRISFYCNVLSTVFNDNLIVQIFDGTTPGGSEVSRGSIVPGLASYGVSLPASTVQTGLSGSQTRRLVGVRNAGTGSMTFEASAAHPAWIMVEDIGPA